MAEDHDMMPERMAELRQGVHEAVEQAPSEARQAVREEFRRHWKWAVFACFLVSLVVALATGVGVLNLYGRQATTDAAVASLRQQAEQSKTQGDAANSELAQRGQAPVPIPEPGRDDDSEVIVASATARVLASLPNPQPSSGDLGRAIAEYFAANPMAPQAPTPQELASALAGYFATNPPPSGPRGDPGQPGNPGADGQPGQAGRPPTRDEIAAAFVAYISANPDALCPRGGNFTQLRVLLADGASADTWQCVVSTNPPTTSPPPTTSDTPNPIPTS